MSETPAERRDLASKGATASPRNRPLRGIGDRIWHGSGRGKGDWRHSMMQDQMGCLVSLAAAAPIVWFLGSLLGFW